MPSKLLAYAQIGRISNAPTALADVVCGLAISGCTWWSAGVFLGLTSLLLYTAGMVLNDVFDAPLDSIERPERPIPAGKISLSTARRLGWGLLFVGLACAGVTFNLLSAVVSGILAGLIVLYNGVAKNTSLGFVAMGACRGANVALGLSVGGVEAIASLPGVAIIAGIATYIAGVTMFSRREASESCRVHLAAGWLVSLLGIGLLAALPELGVAIRIQTAGWWLLWGLLAVMVSRRMVAAILQPQPKQVQSAVGQAIVSLVYLHASLALGLTSPGWGLAILALAPIAVILQVWIRPT